LNGSGLWHAERAWIGRVASNVLIEVEDGRIKSVAGNTPPPTGATRLSGFTIPGLANAHSHAFQRQLRGLTHEEGGDFWVWRRQMYRLAEAEDPDEYFIQARSVYREMVEAGITAVGEFHYLHKFGNRSGEALIAAADAVGIRITLIDACYLRGGMDGRALEGGQRGFSDGTAEKWATRMDSMKDSEGVRIGAAIHSVRAVDPRSMRIVAEWARKRGAPLHMHLAEQPAEVEECLAVEGCTPTQLAAREGILGPDLTAIHAVHVDEMDIALLGESRTAICACPTTERDLGDRVGPSRSLVDAGASLCLGSDSNAVIDPLEEARGVELDQRRATGRRGMHRPDELLRAATADGMRAIGWDSGELAAGKLADFVTVQAAAWPVHHEVAYLIYACSAGDVSNVVIGGRTVKSA
jgi:formiminoglutamate deiminase